MEKVAQHTPQLGEVLQKARGYYEQGIGSKAYQLWQQEAREAWAFYDGHQWRQEEVDKLAANAQPVIVINKIAAKVDNIAGSEIAGRTRIVFRSRSGNAGEEETAKALSDLSLYVAERNDQALELSGMFKAGLITGVGWLDVGVEQSEEGPFLFNRVENELHVVWDPNSSRPDFSDARYVCRERWLDAEELRLMFPKLGGKAIEQLTHANPLQTTRYGASDWSHAGETITYYDSKRELYRVVEVQYKQTAKRYTLTIESGQRLITFDKNVVKAYPDAEIHTEDAPQVQIAYFAGDVLLYHAVLPYQHNQFTLIPYVYKRDRIDGRPYGLLRSAMDPQRELNKRRSKAMHLLSTAQVIADIDAVEDPNILAREAARPDGMILKRPGKELKIIRNSDLAQSQVAVMEQAGRDIQEVMGVFDESLGKPSNATSGIAIQQRQVAGSLNQMFAFDALRRSKKALGQQVLQLIRQYFTASMVIHITDDLNASGAVKLNQPVLDEMGKPMRDNAGNILKEHDVQTGVFDVHVEEVRDVLSSREQEAEQLNMLLQAGVPIPPQVLVEATTLGNKQAIIASLSKEINQQENE